MTRKRRNPTWYAALAPPPLSTMARSGPVEGTEPLRLRLFTDKLLRSGAKPLRAQRFCRAAWLGIGEGINLKAEMKVPVY